MKRHSKNVIIAVSIHFNPDNRPYRRECIRCTPCPAIGIVWNYNAPYVVVGAFKQRIIVITTSVMPYAYQIVSHVLVVRTARRLNVTIIIKTSPGVVYLYRSTANRFVIQQIRARVRTVFLLICLTSSAREHSARLSVVWVWKHVRGGPETRGFAIKKQKSIKKI